MRRVLQLVLSVCGALICGVARAEPSCEVDGIRLTVSSSVAGHDESLWEDWSAACGRLRPFLSKVPKRPELVGRRLSVSGYFDQVKCEQQAPKIHCALVPARIVSAVKLKGSLPFVVLEQDLLRRLALKPGTQLAPDDRDLKKQQKRFEVYMTRQGYFDTEVKLTLKPEGGAEPSLGVLLEIHVRSGWSSTIRRARIVGAPPALHEDIEDIVRHPWFLLFGEERFKPERFEEDMGAVTRFLQKKGYESARVKGRYRADTEAQRVDIDLEVALGPKLTVRFEGNKELDRDDLEELMTFREAGALDEVEVESTRSAILRAYQKEGYDQVSITALVERPSPEESVVVYSVEEGRSVEVEKVRFVGNRSIPADQLTELAELKTHDGRLFSSGRLVNDWLDRDRRAIESVYRKRGHGAVSVKVEHELREPGALEVRFVIFEGPKREVSEVHLIGLPQQLPERVMVELLLLKAGAPFEERLVVVDRRRILAALAQRGFLGAEVRQQVDVPSPDLAGDAILTYRVKPGPKALYGGALTQGNFRTSRGLLERKLRLTPGGALDLVQVGAARRRLRALGLFGSVSLRPLEQKGEEDQETWLLVSVEEREVRTLDAVLSFATDDYFALGFDYRDRNLFGQAITLDANVRLSNASELIHEDAKIGRVDNIRTRVLLPELYGLPFDINADIYYLLENRARFRDRRIGGGLGVSRRLSSRSACAYCPDITAALGYELVASKFTDMGADPDLVQGRTTGAIARIVPSLSFDRRDSFVDPRRGYSAFVRFEFAHKALAGTLEAAANFLKVRTGVQGYLPLFTLFREPLGEVVVFGGPMIFAAGAKYGWIRPLGGDQVPLSETFYYGGDADVRGLARGASLGTGSGAFNSFVGTAELRWYILQNFGFGDLQLAGFVDLGTVSQTSDQLFKRVTVSAGPALRYVTPVGPLSFSYGWALVTDPNILTANAANPDLDLAPKNGRFHFTFGYTF